MKHVLIVDDDVNIQELLSTYLKHAGYGVILSSDGRDALKQCVIRKPDAILMDFRMPRLDGLNALDLMTLTAMGKRIPILMMSGMASPEVIETCKRLGASDFLVKPFNPDELLKKIDFFINSGPKQPTFPPAAPPAPAVLKRGPVPTPAPVVVPPPPPAPVVEPHFSPPVPESIPEMEALAPHPSVLEAMPELTPEAPPPQMPEFVAAPVYDEAPPSAGVFPVHSEAPPDILTDLMISTEPTGESPGPLAGLSSIDRHFAQMLYESSNALQKELVMKAIEEFTKRAVTRLVDIQMALREERFEEVVSQAQQLKEESLSLGAHQFAGLSAELEELAKKQAPEGIRKIRGMREEYQRCEADFAMLRQAMENTPQR